MSNKLQFLESLEDIIQERLESNDANSYTANLVASGGTRVAQKVGEEAIELVLAATAGTRDEQLEEAADLMFHLLVLLRTKNISLQAVSQKLQDRHEMANKD